MAFIKLTPTGCIHDRLRAGGLSGGRDLYPVINTVLFFFRLVCLRENFAHGCNLVLYRPW